MAQRDAAKIEALKSIVSASVTATYADLGVALAANAAEILFVNGSDKLMIVSADDGTTDHFQLPPTSQVRWTAGSSDLSLDAGSQLQVKLFTAGAATAGALVSATVTTSKPLTI